MNEFHIRIHHPELQNLSDRTFRQILKRASVLIREIQLAEVLDFIDEIELTQPQRQSLRDSVISSIETVPAYYVEKVERSSLELAIVATAGAWWLLDKTVGESVSVAFQKTELHRLIVEKLSTPFGRKNLKDIALDKSKEANFGRLEIDDRSAESESDIVRLNLELSTTEEERQRTKDFLRLDESMVINQANRSIETEEQDS